MKNFLLLLGLTIVVLFGFFKVFSISKSSEINNLALKSLWKIHIPKVFILYTSKLLDSLKKEARLSKLNYENFEKKCKNEIDEFNNLTPNSMIDITKINVNKSHFMFVDYMSKQKKSQEMFNKINDFMFN